MRGGNFRRHWCSSENSQDRVKTKHDDHNVQNMQLGLDSCQFPVSMSWTTQTGQIHILSIGWCSGAVYMLAGHHKCTLKTFLGGDNHDHDQQNAKCEMQPWMKIPEKQNLVYPAAWNARTLMLLPRGC